MTCLCTHENRNCFGFDPYNAQEFVARWESENGPFGIEKVIQGAKTESVPLGELKKLSEERMLLFDEEFMAFAMGNYITMEDTNGNRKLLKKRYEQKIDSVVAMVDAYVAYKANKDAFEYGGENVWKYNYTRSFELYHYGVKGMKWGVRKTLDQREHQKTSIEKTQKSDIIK